MWGLLGVILLQVWAGDCIMHCTGTLHLMKPEHLWQTMGRRHSTTVRRHLQMTLSSTFSWRKLFLFWLEFNWNVFLNSSPPGAAYMCRWTGSVLVQIMACRLISTKPLSEPMLIYCQLDPKEHISMKFYLKFKHFQSRKGIWACCLWNGGHSVQGEIS